MCDLLKQCEAAAAGGPSPSVGHPLLLTGCSYWAPRLRAFSETQQQVHVDLFHYSKVQCVIYLKELASILLCYSSCAFYWIRSRKPPGMMCRYPRRDFACPRIIYKTSSPVCLIGHCNGFFHRLWTLTLTIPTDLTRWTSNLVSTILRPLWWKVDKSLS